jgi:hypothetical protein
MTQTFVGNESVAQDLIMPRKCGTESYGQEKVQTALLLRPESATGPRHITSAADVEAVAFGDHAEAEYTKIPRHERDSFIFLKWFKMSLWEQQGTSDPVLPNSGKGRFTVSLSVALTKSLELFKEGGMDHLRRDTPDIATTDVVWALTIPAIWEERAKHLMRSAAYAAGLIDDINSEKLILCLEPEGVAFAALLVEQLIAAPGIASVGGGPGSSGAGGAKKAAGDSAQIAAVLKTRGTKYVVLDAGGGTIDIA